MLIATNGADWYRITHSLRAITEATNAGILEGATIEEKQRGGAAMGFAGRNPKRLIRTALWLSFGTLLSNEWFILNHRIYFNHCVYGKITASTGNLGPNYLQLRPSKPVMLRRTRTAIWLCDSP